MSATDAAKGRGSRWGDRDNDDAGDGDNQTGRIETIDEKTGVKTVTEVHTDEQGRRVKMVRKFKTQKKVVKVSKKVLERRKWKKFGDCAGLPAGPERNITYPSAEVIKLDLAAPLKKEEEEDANPLKNMSLLCRFCGEKGHWTLKCPKRSQAAPRGFTPDLSTMPESPREGAGAGATSAGGKYVPPAARRGAGAGGPGERGKGFGDDFPTLRVTNLSEDTSEADLADLFKRFGPTQRIYLAKDRNTGASRGFAFVSYIKKEDAAQALLKLDGYGYDNLILRVEWAKPRDEKDN